MFRSLLFALSLLSVLPAHADVALDNLRLPDGFSVTLFADNVPGARTLRRGDYGTIFVSTRRHEKVYALRDTDGDQVADKRYVIVDDMNMPNGIDLLDGDLYVAENAKIWRFDDIEQHLDDPPQPTLIYDELPTASHHGWRYMGFGPDRMLYVSVGAPCNVCDEYGEIWRMTPNGRDKEIFAKGVRNSVGFDWHPGSGVLWFTDNGRDWMGDNLPDDELNRAPQSGMHFGFPWCHSGDTQDPEFNQRKCSEFVPPKQKLGPHVAALGMRFYTGDQFPASYRNRIFIAKHGSWNRSTKSGYNISMVTLDGSNVVGHEVFMDGWIEFGNAWGRPVDVLVMPDGSLLISDDAAGVVYRVSYNKP